MEILLYTSGDEDEVAQLESLFSQAPDLAVSVVSESPLLVGRLPLPFIQLPEGRRHFGLSSIRKFLARYAEVAAR